LLLLSKSTLLVLKNGSSYSATMRVFDLTS
jgi:hypothetical protein